MNKATIAGLFFATIILDGIFLPGIFGIKESFLTIVFIVALLFFQETDLSSLVFGTLLSGSAEFYWGLSFGVLMIPFLFSAGILALLKQFLNVRGFIMKAVSFITILFIFWKISFFVNYLFYV